MHFSSFFTQKLLNIFYKLFLFFLVFITSTATAQSVWTSQNSGTTMDLYSVTWKGDLFVAVGDSGIIITSPDGVTWTKQNSGVAKRIKSVCWSGNQLVAVGSNRCIVTSPDGIQWTQINFDSLSSFSEVIWTGDKYIAVGNLIITSLDGITWNVVFNSAPARYYDVAYSGKKFIAADGDAGWLATSSDGITWQEHLDTIIYFGDIIWTDSLFVAINSYYAYTSQNGENWNTYTIFGYKDNLPARSFMGHSIVWTGDLLVCVTYKKIFTSPDAITWTLVKDSVILNGIYFSNDKFVAVGNDGVILTSPRDVNIVKTPNAIKSNHTILLRLHGNKLLNAILPSTFNDNSIRSTIYSMSGKIVFENISAINSGKIECDIANLSSGVYTFVARGKGLELKKIFLIEK